MSRLGLVLPVFLLLVSSHVAHSADPTLNPPADAFAGVAPDAPPPSPPECPSVRRCRKLGLDLNLLGEPYTSVFGTSLHWNFTDFFRASASFNLPGAALGIKLLFPEINVSPLVGVSLSYTLSNGEFFGAWTLPIGIDWTDDSGLHVGAGVNVALYRTVTTQDNLNPKGVAWLPYATFGGFFK